MVNMIKNFYDFLLSRLVGFGSDIPITEDVQNSLLLLLQDHGKVTALHVVDLLYANHPKERMIREVLQAGQILVNQGHITAFQNGSSIDPVYGTEETEFRFTP